MACHTHELLSCPCGSASSALASDDDEASTNEAPAKPHRKFVQDDSDEEEEEKGFVFATQVDPEKQSKSVSPRVSCLVSI